MPLPEKALIARIRRHAGSPRRGIGIGDDCAVLPVPRGHELLVTTDFSLEGIHFRREWHPAISVGHRCLARGLSDIAAMGGTPIAAFLSLALPADLPQSWVDNFIKGVLRLAAKFDVSLAGGDTAQSPEGVLADIVVVGSVPSGKAILRSVAKPGDRIYVSGTLGGSAAALDLLFAGKKLRPADFRRHFYPEPRIVAGKFLREKKLATSMIDTSDGLSTDLEHICKESNVGAEIYEEKLPRALVGKSGIAVPLKQALHGGEDYELLFTASSRKKMPSRIAGVAITEIGRITQSKQMKLIDLNGTKTQLRPQGWEHFSVKK
jgi:thiamine-monophosphate kinase